MIGHTWEEKRPSNGQEIEFYEKRADVWHRGFYYDDGIDGIVAWLDAAEWEVEEYGGHMFPYWREVTK